MLFVIIPRKFKDQKSEKVAIFWENKELKKFVFMNLVLSQATAVYPDFTL